MFNSSSIKKPVMAVICGIMALMISAQGALALGPFSHLLLAREAGPELLAAVGLEPDTYPELEPVMFAGALAPDAGYYAEGLSPLADLAHLNQPWEFVQALFELARTPQEKAFALGWFSHALLDLRAHGELVNPAVNGVYNDTVMAHKQFEWGLDCVALSEEQNAWLWDVSIDAEAGLDLWNRALYRVYGYGAGKSQLLRAMESEAADVALLPWVFWLGGRLELKGRGAVNSVGWVLGHTARPAMVKFMEWRNMSLDIRAVLTTQTPTVEQIRHWEQIIDSCPQEMRELLATRDWPSQTLDADPACADSRCVNAKKALAWLRNLE
ncbi:MAG: zinc dependent phospholipase C family protein [Desulfarculaceae bacterium]|jgi:hypothetical protein